MCSQSWLVWGDSVRAELLEILAGLGKLPVSGFHECFCRDTR